MIGAHPQCTRSYQRYTVHERDLVFQVNFFFFCITSTFLGEESLQGTGVGGRGETNPFNEQSITTAQQTAYYLCLLSAGALSSYNYLFFDSSSPEHDFHLSSHTIQRQCKQLPARLIQSCKTSLFRHDTASHPLSLFCGWGETTVCLLTVFPLPFQQLPLCNTLPGGFDYLWSVGACVPEALASAFALSTSLFFFFK